MRFFFLLILLTSSTFVAAQIYKISGVVKGDSTGQPLKFTSVFVPQNKAVANKTGEFQLYVTAGSIVQFSRFGYSFYSYIVKRGVEIEIRLRRQAYRFDRTAKSFVADTVAYGRIVTENFSDDSLPNNLAEADSSQDKIGSYKVVEPVEIGPSLRNRDSNTLKLLSKNVKVKGKLSGRLKLGFVIGVDGVKDVVTLISYAKEIDEQVRGNLYKIPMNPAFQNFGPIDVYCELDLDVKISKRLLILTVKDP